MTAADTDESGIWTAAYEQTTGRKWVPVPPLDFAGWTREAVGDTEGEMLAAEMRGDYSSEGERRRASQDDQNQRLRAEGLL